MKFINIKNVLFVWNFVRIHNYYHIEILINPTMSKTSLNKKKTFWLSENIEFIGPGRHAEFAGTKYVLPAN